MIAHSPLRPSDLTDYLGHPSEAEIEMRRLFRPGDPLVIFDVGACEGEDTIRYARLFRNARLFAVEALPANQALLRMQLAAHGVDRARLFPLALSDRAGMAEFHVSAGRPTEAEPGADLNYGNKSSSLLAPEPGGDGWLQFPETIQVPTQTLDACCDEAAVDSIDFIQMDVQGAERMVLAGAERMLPRVTAIWMEVARTENYLGRALDREIHRFMRSRGFKLCFQAYRGNGSGEGDHFYLNLRRPRTWGYAATRRLRSLLGDLRRRRAR